MKKHSSKIKAQNLPPIHIEVATMPEPMTEAPSVPMEPTKRVDLSAIRAYIVANPEVVAEVNRQQAELANASHAERETLAAKQSLADWTETEGTFAKGDCKIMLREGKWMHANLKTLDIVKAKSLPKLLKLIPA